MAAIAALHPRPASADPLNPGAFPVLGGLSLPAGTFTIDTGTPGGADPTFRLGNLTFTGTVFAQGASFDPEVAVFNFTILALGDGTVINVTGSRPLALLSRNDIAFNGNARINLTPGAAGGAPGSTNASTGSGPGTGGSSDPTVGGGGGGGGFGGAGGAGGGIVGSGGAPGPAYGDLTSRLQGGSGGGAGLTLFDNGVGGAGGGGIELGALGRITLSAASVIDAHGSSGIKDPVFMGTGGGGGSGGGILLHAPTMNVPAGSLLNAPGGAGGSQFAGSPGGGGGGGGGRALALVDLYTVGETALAAASINVSGGPGGTTGGLPGSPGAGDIVVNSIVVPAGQVLDFNDGRITGGARFAGKSLTIQGGGTAQAATPFTNTGTVMVDTGGLFSAYQLINADAGAVTIADGAVVLSKGAVSGNGAYMMDGGRLLVPGGLSLDDRGTISGRGSVEGQLTVPSGTSTAITVLGGTLTAGESASLNGTDVDRPIVIGAPSGPAQPGTLRLRDANHATIGNTQITSNSALQATNGITLRAGRQLTAADHTTISGTFTNLGTVNGPTAPADELAFSDDVDGTGNFGGNVRFDRSYAPGATPGGIAFNGNMRLTPSGGLRVTLSAPPGSAQRVQVNVTGQAVLAGTLQITTAPGFSPAPLAAFNVLNSASRTGTFASYSGTNAGNGLVYAPVYTSTALTLVATRPGDANVDGKVDFNDLVALAQHYNTAGDLWTTGDFTYDGLVDFNDLVLLAQNYNTTLPTSPIPGAPSEFETDLAAVPEPSTLIALAACGFALFTRRRRR